jgi:hypothetical protein
MSEFDLDDGVWHKCGSTQFMHSSSAVDRVASLEGGKWFVYAIGFAVAEIASLRNYGQMVATFDAMRNLAVTPPGWELDFGVRGAGIGWLTQRRVLDQENRAYYEYRFTKRAAKSSGGNRRLESARDVAGVVATRPRRVLDTLWAMAPEYSV